MALLKMTVIILVLFSFSLAAMQQPIPFLSLPVELQRKIVVMTAEIERGIHVHHLAKTVLTLSGTNKKMREYWNKPEKIIGILNKIPYTAGAVYCFEKLARMPGMSHPDVRAWIDQAHAHLQPGEALCKSIRENNRKDTLACLENKHIDINWNAGTGLTPLTLAVHGKQIDIVKTLLALGANPNVQVKAHKTEAGERESWTPLFWAALDGCVECIEVLLAHNARPNIQDRLGCSALMMAAARCQDSRVIALLLNAGADPDLQDNNNKTAYHFARIERRHSAIDLLKEASEKKQKTEEKK